MTEEFQFLREAYYRQVIPLLEEYFSDKELGKKILADKSLYNLDNLAMIYNDFFNENKGEILIITPSKVSPEKFVLVVTSKDEKLMKGLEKLSMGEVGN